MNQITRPSGIATATGRDRHRWKPRRLPRSGWSKPMRSREGSSRGVLLGSLGLALLATVAMWPETTTAQILNEPISSKNPRRTGRSSALAKTATSVAPGRRSERPAVRQPTKPTKSAKKPRGRLPRYFGKVGLSVMQRERIYAIQVMHREQTEVLMRQLKVLKVRQDREVRDVLTSLQQDRLRELIRMAEAAREARSRARRSKGLSPAPKRKRQ